MPGFGEVGVAMTKLAKTTDPELLLMLSPEGNTNEKQVASYPIPRGIL